MTAAVTVFLGPSLPAAEAAALLPRARILPPVRHGDLLRLDPAPGDSVLIIDGLFLQTASVRHREILALLERGVTVAGGSSMGALRAAELWRYGMRGYGEVFRLYRDGEIDGDDEVAVVHGVAEDGHRAFSEPLVAIRVALRRAREAGALTGAEADLMLAAVAALPFRSRSLRTLDLMRPAGADAGDRFQAWRRGRDTDLKAADARLLLRAAAARDPGLRPAGAGDEPIRNVHTWIFDMWEHEHHGAAAAGEWVADAQAAAALRLFHPAFPDEHRRHLLSRVAGVPGEHPALVAHAAAAARARGLTAADGGWLTAADLPLSEDERLARLLVRGIGGSRRWSPTRPDLPPRLRTAAALAAGARVVRAARPYQGSATLGAAQVDGLLAAAWGCRPAELESGAWDRGVPDLPTLRRIAAPFAGYLRAPETTSAINAVMSVV